tara:strand:+ start:600 stop:1124 length:525 start_codon:yes stop_codon:yes gene_type:complete
MDLKKYVGCKENDNSIICYITKYAPKTWSVWSIILLLLSVVLKVNKKIIFFMLCAVILNSIMGFILIQFLAKKKLMKIFNISYPLLTFYDILVHIIPLFMIFKYYTPPKITTFELSLGFIVLSSMFLIYDNIMDIEKMYLSVSILKFSKPVNIIFYLFCYLLIINLYKKKITFL